MSRSLLTADIFLRGTMSVVQYGKLRVDGFGILSASRRKHAG